MGSTGMNSGRRLRCTAGEDETVVQGSALWCAPAHRAKQSSTAGEWLRRRWLWQEKAQRALGVGVARLGPSTGAALTGSGGSGACGGAGQKLRWRSNKLSGSNFTHGGSRRRSSFTPAVRYAFMLSSFVLSFFSLGGAGGIISSLGMTDAVNSPSTASLFFTNSSCSL